MISSNSIVSTFLESSRFQRTHWLLEKFEGFRSTVYQDSGGYNTVGYGHQIFQSLEEDDALKDLDLTPQHILEGLSSESAIQLLAHDLIYRANIEPYFKVSLTDEIWTSLTSFCFNIGLTRFKQSNAFKYFSNNNLYQTAESMSSWRECENMFSEGIAKRRLCEVMVLLQKPLTIQSPLLPSKQFETTYPMTYTDDNWTRLSIDLKEEAIDIYHQYQKKFVTI